MLKKLKLTKMEQQFTSKSQTRSQNNFCMEHASRQTLCKHWLRIRARFNFDDDWQLNYKLVKTISSHWLHRSIIWLWLKTFKEKNVSGSWSLSRRAWDLPEVVNHSQILENSRRHSRFGHRFILLGTVIPFCRYPFQLIKKISQKN